MCEAHKHTHTHKRAANKTSVLCETIKYYKIGFYWYSLETQFKSNAIYQLRIYENQRIKSERLTGG